MTKVNTYILALATLTLAIPFMGRAQQTPVFSEYNYNPFLINAAYAGVENGAEATLSNSGFNSQFDGTPQNLSFTFNTRLNEGKMGLGAGIINDQIGVTNATQIFAAYAYKIYLNDNMHPYWKVYDRSFISFGLSAGALLYNEDLLQLGLQGDPNFAENINATLPAAGMGILFGHANFFAGVSIPNVLGDTFANQDNIELSRPMYAYTGYHFATNRYDPQLILKPSLLFKYENGAPFQVDVNLSANFKNAFELGAGFRTGNTFNFVAGFYLFKNFRALYNYSQIALGNAPIANTHGILLSYRAGDGFGRR
ncbi:Bacteroidetes-specific Putative membrane protein [Croceitalea dokdonensis DOKDO 023]|uniref:Bacteroidetes-specific Putative membrane protein n=1 Tax=Croceitalea dokdonensis DOKDO 023 TaxID=1300341 RepID=A0A0P7B170_9FLAO|nr:PorP/SprF family type IX secretion system membrane protein [Croceitalea dokdonensis]KPM32725.1 Bacteroidetes-specific Putative membrane protein [Croceitalea dokdonensis DOKDO 023]